MIVFRSTAAPPCRSFAVRALLCLGALALVVLAAGPRAAAESDAGDARAPGMRLDLGAVQGILAVQQLDGWLLYDHRGQNPIARELIHPGGEPGRRWFYWIPAEGEPTALVHKVDAGLFAHVPGQKVVYTSHRELRDALRTLVRRERRVAMEYSPEAELPVLSRVDAGTFELVRAQMRSRRARIVSSAELVQVANSVWGPEGRRAHYVAAHHVTELREQALAFVADQIRAGVEVTERDVQELLQRGYQVRGLVGPPPVVAASAHTADPSYVPTAATAIPIREGDLVLIELRARLARASRPVFAEATWMAYVGARVPQRYAQAFAAVAGARDAAVALIRARTQRRRAVRGHEVDRSARAVIREAGHGARFVHRTGHSLDTSAHSAGVQLDGFEVRDTRPLILGAGFCIEPGIYFDGEFGVRAAANVHLGRAGVELTLPTQQAITAVLAE